MTETDIEHLLFVYALQNAVKHDSPPKTGTVIGTLLGRHPEFRSSAREIGAIASKVAAEVAGMSSSERRARLEAGYYTHLTQPTQRIELNSPGPGSYKNIKLPRSDRVEICGGSVKYKQKEVHNRTE